jgi:hypothetical protein
MFDMEQRYRQLQRATVARSALDVIALIFLGAGFSFWGVAFWQLLTPPALLSLLTIQAVVLALVYSLAAPLLLSMLVPTTPAGQLLQKTQWRTIGFPVIVGCALFLAYQAEYMIELWLYAQTAVREANFARPMAISLMIAFVVIPALAWVQLTPERWLQQIQQAHQVRRLEIQQSGELAILKARMLWAKQKAAVDFANLLPIEQQEVLDTVRGLFMSIGDTQRDIARTLGISAEIEREMLGDETIVKQLDYVAQAMLARTVDIPAERDTSVQAPRQDAAPVSPHPRPATAAIPAPQRPAALRSAPQRYAAEYETAHLSFRARIWTVAELASVLDMKERTARERLDAWLEDGRAAKSETKGHYYLTESGGG